MKNVNPQNHRPRSGALQAFDRGRGRTVLYVLPAATPNVEANVVREATGAIRKLLEWAFVGAREADRVLYLYTPFNAKADTLFPAESRVQQVRDLLMREAERKRKRDLERMTG